MTHLGLDSLLLLFNQCLLLLDLLFILFHLFVHLFYVLLMLLTLSPLLNLSLFYCVFIFFNILCCFFNRTLSRVLIYPGVLSLVYKGSRALDFGQEIDKLIGITRCCFLLLGSKVDRLFLEI